MSLQAIDRVIAILKAIAGGDTGINEVARRTGLSKGTVHRMLVALQGHRLVQQNQETRQYRLGLGLMELGARVIEQIDYGRIAHGHLKQLVDATSETAHLALMGDGKVYYAAKVEGSRALRMPSHVGATNPLHCTAVGKVLLANAPDGLSETMLHKGPLACFTPRTITSASKLKSHLAMVLARGYAVDDEEREAGLRCIAAPVRNHTGKVVAAVSISGPVSRIGLSAERGQTDFIALVRSTAEAISRDLGAPAPNGPHRTDRQRSARPTTARIRSAIPAKSGDNR
jgi:DNA-binding IclR family transcriptional regulator